MMWGDEESRQESAAIYRNGTLYAYDAGYYTGWVRGFLTAIGVAVLALVLLAIL